MHNIFFINHIQKQCGVHQFGYRIGKVLETSNKFNIKYLECNSVKELQTNIDEHQPTVIIYNFYESTMPWCVTFPTTHPHIKHILIRHEPEPAKLPSGFYEIYPDPTEPELFGKWKTGRLVMPYNNPYELPEIPTFGSFGFVFGKYFQQIIQLVEAEFDEAIINLRIPSADFGDSEGIGARNAGDVARKTVTKPGITLNVSHDFLSEDQLIDSLARNSANIFCYDKNWGRGISSTLDYALTARRPIALNNSMQFKHLTGINNLVRVPEYVTLKIILEQGNTPLEKYQEAWSPKYLLKTYERILDECINS